MFALPSCIECSLCYFLPRHSACAPSSQSIDDVYPVKGGIQWGNVARPVCKLSEKRQKSFRGTQTWEVRKVWRSPEGARRATMSCGWVSYRRCLLLAASIPGRVAPFSPSRVQWREAEDESRGPSLKKKSMSSKGRGVVYPSLSLLLCCFPSSLHLF